MGQKVGRNMSLEGRVLVLHPLSIRYKWISSGASRYFEQASRGLPEGKDGSGGDGAVSLGIKALKISAEIGKIRSNWPKSFQWDAEDISNFWGLEQREKS